MKDLILFIMPTNIGDFILASPVMNFIKNKYPDLKWIVIAGKAPLELLIINNNVLKTYPVEDFKGIKGKIRLFILLRKYSFKAIIDLRKTLFPFILSANKKYFRFSKGNSHVLIEHLKILGKDFPKQFPGYPSFSNYKDNAVAKNIVLPLRNSSYSPIIIINPDANWKHKRWKPEYWERLLEILSENFNKAHFIITGLNKRINVKGHNITDLTGKLSLRELAALLSQGDIFITNDSGPMHLSVSVNTPTLGIFGPSLPKKYAPYGKKHIYYKNTSRCEKCLLTKCDKDFWCLKNTAPETIAELAVQLLNG